MGSTGLLGVSLCKYLELLGAEVISAGRGQGVSYSFDITNSNSLKECLMLVKPSVIINLVAATNVDQCEFDPVYAYNANVLVPLSIKAAVKSCPDLDIFTLHISSDQVYSGSGPHSEEFVGPVNIYGLTKYFGELVLNPLDPCILRTNFFGRSLVSGRTSFSDWIVSSLQQRKSITLYDDVMFSPLSISSLCMIIARVIDKRIAGTFNLGSKSPITKAQMGVILANQLDLPIANLQIGSYFDVATKVKRPLDMSLNISKIETRLGILCPEILDEINLVAREYSNV